MRIYQELYEDVFHLLHTQLPPYLTYHTAQHTAYVLERAEFIAEQESITGHDLMLIKVAALFHDVGFIHQNIQHEEKSCEICIEKLTRHQFDTLDIDKVCGMIMATKIPQQPQTLLERILADADLEYLGTDLFYPMSQNLFIEFRHYDPELTLQRFNEIQVSFIQRHKYHTQYCMNFREEIKQMHLKALQDSMQSQSLPDQGQFF